MIDEKKNKAQEDWRDIPITNGEEGTNDDIEERVDSDTEPVLEQEENLEKLLRLKAEFVNYKRRTEKEKLDLSGFVKSQLIYRLLPVIDDFELMFSHANDDRENLSECKTIYKKMLSILESEGLEAINSTGEEFDPNIHEAMMIEHSDQEEDNKIIEEWQKGYTFKSKLLRAAKVKVLKHKE